METKVWWKSKSLWVAIIAMAATAYQEKYGMVISPEYQGYALAVIMFILRLVTTEPVTLKK
jgi:hypothetical protein